MRGGMGWDGMGWDADDSGSLNSGQFLPTSCLVPLFGLPTRHAITMGKVDREHRPEQTQ